MGMTMRMQRCENTEALSNYTFIQGLTSKSDVEREEKRDSVIDLARDFIQGLPVTVRRFDRDYSRDDLLVDVQEHELYDNAVFAAYAGDANPMRDLVIRCAQYAVCEYLYPCEESYLGFSR